MKIKSLQLKNFKRFTDLTIQDIPGDTKLVLLVGNNGSGKSSIFDAFENLSTLLKPGVSHTTAFQFTNPNEYYSKIEGLDYEISLIDTQNRSHKKNNQQLTSSLLAKNFYGRSSFRQIPVLTRKTLGTESNLNLDSDRPVTFIDRDYRFENDIEKITGYILNEVFRSNKSTEEIREKYIDPINHSFSRVFGAENGIQLLLIEIIPPLEGKIANIRFKKGKSEFHYNLLSAGEKEVFNVLINLVARQEYYDDTIFFFDEIDLHLNTELQYNFLKEIIENWIPDNCQLWTASHSLGFIEYATDFKEGSVIDLDQLDFDKPQVLSPKPKNDLEIFEIAVSKAFIDKVVQGRKIIFSENTNTPFYNDLNLESILFFVALDKNDVFYKAKNHKQHGIIDRDYLSDVEITQIRIEYPFLFILPYYSFENLLYHPDNLIEYYSYINKPFNKEEYISKITAIKNSERDYLSAGIVLARNGYPFFKENDNAKKLRVFKDSYKAIIDILRSDDFETYYKVFPAKDYGRDIDERKNIPQSALSKTKWFRQQLESIVK